jgi:hypothetical protein
MTVEDQPTAAQSVAARIKQQLQTLDNVQELELAEHADRYAAVHSQLQSALTEIDGGST